MTVSNTGDNITIHCNSSGGRENSFSKGFNKPQILIAVFFMPSIRRPKISGRFNMMGLFGQSLWLVAPLRGILTPHNSITNTVRSIGGVYTTLSKGITP